MPELAAEALKLAAASGLTNDEIVAALKAAAKSVSQPKMTLRETIFKTDGTVRGVDYGKPSTRRGAVLQIRLKSEDAGKFQTSLLVDGKDFHAVYSSVVKMVAEHFKLKHDDDLFGELVASKEKFLQSKGLTTKRVEVAYEQLVAINEN